jgi:hypothetical protein
MRTLVLVTTLVIATILTLGPGIAWAGSTVSPLATDKVYGVEIIAYDNCPAGSFTGSNRRMIAVKADFTSSVMPGQFQVNVNDKENLILLTPGLDFQVLDGNACDSDGALLQLPPDVSATFQVWVRLVGKPGSGIDAFTCAQIPGTNDIVCSTTTFMKTRLNGKNGPPTFTSATDALLQLTLTAGELGMTACATTPVKLFDNCLENFFWVWDTTGRPHAQVWFVQID